MANWDKDEYTSNNIEPCETSCGFVSIIGPPNAGKSTLVNYLVGSKVSIVTHKVQTTRMVVRGVVMKDQSQIVLVDTPGIFKPKRTLEKAMVNAAWTGAKDADICALMIDAKTARDESLEPIITQLKESNLTKILLLNKIDLCAKEKLLRLAEKLNESIEFEQTFMISSVTGSGTDDLLNWLSEQMPKGPWLFDPDQLSDLPLKTLAADITREKLLLRVHKEIPYAATVETDKFEITGKGDIRIEQTIYVERASHKQIILGQGGSSIKSLGQMARHELQDILDTKVHLFLFVKVVKGWSRDPHRYLSLGLELPK